MGSKNPYQNREQRYKSANIQVILSKMLPEVI